MENGVRKKLWDEAAKLIDSSELTLNEKANLKQNIEYLLSIITRDSVIKDCKWEWFKDDDKEIGLDLVWDRDEVKGRFGIYTDNSFSFGFSFGSNGTCEWCGGDEGTEGFYPDYDIHELELMLITNHLIDDGI